MVQTHCFVYFGYLVNIFVLCFDMHYLTAPIICFRMISLYSGRLAVIQFEEKKRYKYYFRL